MKARIQHSGTRESVATVTLRADGDPDADEEADAVGTLVYVAMHRRHELEMTSARHPRKHNHRTGTDRHVSLCLEAVCFLLALFI